MATLAEIHALVAGNPDLRQRFLAARLKSAWTVLNEADTVADHAARLLWANAVVADYTWDADPQYRRFCANTTIQNSASNATDVDVQSVVNYFVTAWGLALVPEQVTV